MGRRQCRLPLLHLPSPVSALQQRWSEGWNRLCIPRRSHGVVLGKCSLVDGIPVQLGQTTGPLRTLRHLPRTDISHPHRNVAWRDSRNRALGNDARHYRLASLRPTRYPLMATRRPDVCTNSRFLVCSLNSTGATDLTPVYRDLLLLAIMGITLLFAASKALKILEEKGRRAGTIAVRQK